ncbi:transposase family protein [Sulfobacillus harzensis]|uniref:Transposase n=1 Tax=Sulfobacillus harzensis TaxID=2729629 RepID=A0A7Y0Q3C5_9FIRM|nr:transposase family protein [Sulfobacillus harzensis]NMP22054.1 transposase [Sulfobacillus harzensis]
MSLFSIPECGMRVTLVRGTDQPVQVVVESVAHRTPCPACGQWSAQIHSQYTRHLQELPVGSLTVTVELWAHRFVCPTPTCSQHIFCERVPSASPQQRRTAPCTARLLTWAWDMTAVATCQATAAEGMAVSRSTINRLLVRTAVAPRMRRPDGGVDHHRRG